MTLPPKPPGLLRLASYNIRKAVGLDWRRDPGRIMRILSGLSADVVFLQEADRRLGPRPSVLNKAKIAEDLGLDVAPVAMNSVSLGWHGNAVLIRPDFRMGEIERITLPGIEPRGAVLVPVETPHGPLHLVGVHLGLRRRCRLAQVDTIRKHLGPERERRALIVGDFNEWRSSALSPLEDLQVTAPGRSFHASMPVLALDKIVHGPDLRLDSSGVVQTPLTRRASDHLPIWCDVAL